MFDVVSQITLVIAALCSKPLGYFGLHFHSDFHGWPRLSPVGRREKLVGQWRNIRSINQVVGHGVKAFQIRLGRLVHIAFAHRW